MGGGARGEVRGGRYPDAVQGAAEPQLPPWLWARPSLSLSTFTGHSVAALQFTTSATSPNTMMLASAMSGCSLNVASHSRRSRRQRVLVRRVRASSEELPSAGGDELAKSMASAVKGESCTLFFHVQKAG